MSASVMMMILTRLTINFLMNEGHSPETEGEQQNQFYCHVRGLSTLHRPAATLSVR